MKAFSRFEKEILEFYPYVTRGKCCGKPFAQCNHEEKNTGKKCFFCLYGKLAQAYVKHCSS